MKQSDIDAIVAAVVARLSTPTAAPVAPQAASPVHIGPSGRPDGRRFPCTAAQPCGRLLRSAKRAAIHGVDAGGHTAA